MKDEVVVKGPEALRHDVLAVEGLLGLRDEAVDAGPHISSLLQGSTTSTGRAYDRSKGGQLTPDDVSMTVDQIPPSTTRVRAIPAFGAVRHPWK
jgi:hypothetical protein